MSSFRPNNPIEPVIFDFMWEEPNKTWIHTQGSIITVVATLIILYLMCIVWKRSLVRVEQNT